MKISFDLKIEWGVFLRREIFIFIFGFALDWATKIWAVSNVQIYKNYGIAFSLFQNPPRILFFVKIAALILVAAFFMRAKISKAWLALFLAGALGNMLDRILYGYVIDWIYIGLHVNIADVLLCAGSLGILYNLYKTR